MKTSAILLALLLLAAIPLAAADQNQSAGPVTATTASYDRGDACGGPSGDHTRDVSVTTNVAASNNLSANLHQQCYDAYGNDYWGYPESYHGNGTTADLARDGPGQSSATLVSFQWYTVNYKQVNTHQRECYSAVFVLGAGVFPGCPTLDGSGPPIVLLP